MNLRERGQRAVTEIRHDRRVHWQLGQRLGREK